MNMPKIKYHFALNSEGCIIDIAEVTEDNRRDNYYCLSCGEKMRPRLGKKNAHHFAHISTTPNCNPETYLHRLAKYKIKEKFESDAPFEVSLRQLSVCSDKTSCPFYREEECKSSNYRTYNLHNNYDVCREEQTVGNYRADLLLTSSAKPSTPPILIEIYVSHKCEETKTDSGLKIIEIRIKTENDIIKLIETPITESNEYSFDRNAITCHFYNFKKTAISADLEKRKISKLYLYDSGLLHVENYISCRVVLQIDNPKAILELAMDNSSYQMSPYELGYAKAAEIGLDVKNCLLCKYRKDAFGGLMPVPHFCCLYKRAGTPQYPKGNEAMNCSYYRINHENDEQLKSALENTTIIVCK